MPNLSNDDAVPRAPGFPYATVLAALVTLFLFLGIMLFVFRSPNFLREATHEPAIDPLEKLDDVRARNKAVLDGQDPTVKMSVEQSAAALVEQASKSKNAKSPQGRLPFPVEPKAEGGKKP